MLQSDPFQALSFLLHPGSGRFVFRVFGKNHQEGVLEGVADLEKTLWACFHQTIPCAGWSRGEKEGPLTEESTFSPQCQKLIRTEILSELSLGFGMCQSCEGEFSIKSVIPYKDEEECESSDAEVDEDGEPPVKRRRKDPIVPEDCFKAKGLR